MLRQVRFNLARVTSSSDAMVAGLPAEAARIVEDFNRAAQRNPNAAHAAALRFPGEIYRAPRRWAARKYHKLIYWNEVDKGGHLAAFEQPELFTAEIRAAFRSLRKLQQPFTPIAQKAF